VKIGWDCLNCICVNSYVINKNILCNSIERWDLWELSLEDSTHEWFNTNVKRLQRARCPFCPLCEDRARTQQEGAVHKTERVL
jgi:hypothetical protein